MCAAFPASEDTFPLRERIQGWGGAPFEVQRGLPGAQGSLKVGGTKMREEKTSFFPRQLKKKKTNKEKQVALKYYREGGRKGKPSLPFGGN